MSHPKRPYTSLQDYMERTGTTGTELARMAGITQSLMSKILSRSRRCSLKNAWRLSQITGVPIETLAAWTLKQRTDAAAYHDNSTIEEGR